MSYRESINFRCPSVQVITKTKTEGIVVIPNEFYEMLCQEYADKIPDIRKDELFIDRQWALHTMGLD